MARKTDEPGDESLKRLGGGRWQTRDERFTIEPQSGTWAVVDAEETDDFGLPLVRGPFPSLTAAKEAIAAARTSEPATSPLAGRVAADGSRGAKPEPPAKGNNDRRSQKTETGTTGAKRSESAGRDDAAPSRSTTKAAGKPPADEPREPGWLADLSPADRGRARRLIARLAEAGVSDAEGIVRRDLVGGVPALAAVAIARRLEALGSDATPAKIVELLADGKDEALDVRWRIVDGSGRPVMVEPPGRRRRG